MDFNIRYGKVFFVWETAKYEPYLLGWNRNLIAFDLDKVKAYIQDILEDFDEDEFMEWFYERVSEKVEVLNEQIDIKYNEMTRSYDAWASKKFSVTVPLSEYSSELEGKVHCEGKYDHSIAVDSRDFEDFDDVRNILREKVVEWRSQSTSKQEFLALISKLEDTFGTNVFEELKEEVERIDPNVLSDFQNAYIWTFTSCSYVTIANEIEDAMMRWLSDDTPAEAYRILYQYAKDLNLQERVQAGLYDE